MKRHTAEFTMTGFLDAVAPEGNLRSTRAYTRRHARTFYFASHVLPKEKRMAAYAVYAFCRYADNIVDGAAAADDRGLARRRLTELREDLRRWYVPSGAGDPLLEEFRTIVRKYQIPEEHFADLLRGVEMDLTKTRYESFDELREYCYCVASVVGLIMTRIFGAADDRALAHAADLGMAMQLTNILRDVEEDARMGRIYIPAEEMRAFGYSEAELLSSTFNDAFRSLMRFQVDRARRTYAAAAPGIPLLTNDGSRYCVRMMSHTYEGILDVVASRGYNVFAGRAVVPLRRKLRIALQAFFEDRRGDGRASEVAVPFEQAIPENSCVSISQEVRVP
jgi:phytoene synthase